MKDESMPVTSPAPAIPAEPTEGGRYRRLEDGSLELISKTEDPRERTTENPQTIDEE